GVGADVVAGQDVPLGGAGQSDAGVAGAARVAGDDVALQGVVDAVAVGADAVVGGAGQGDAGGVALGRGAVGPGVVARDNVAGGGGAAEVDADRAGVGQGADREDRWGRAVL